MKHAPSTNPEDDFAVEITSLDTLNASETLDKSERISVLVLQGTRLAPKVRTWLTISSVLGGLLLLVIVLFTVLPSLLPKTVHTTLPISNLSSAQIYDVTVQDNVVYVTSSDGTLHALRVKDGTLLWQRKLPNVTPLFVGGTIYIGYFAQNFYVVQAIRAKDGILLWTFKTASNFNPLIIVNGVVYPLSGFSTQDQHILIALDGRNGVEIWEHDLEKANAFLNMNVYSIEDKLYITTWSDYQMQNMTLSVLRISDGMLLWYYNSSGIQQEDASKALATFNFLSTPNGLVYITTKDGSLKALRADDGRQVWQYKATTQGGSTPVMGTNLFYVQMKDGSLKALRADSGVSAWTYKDPWGVSAIFSEVDGILYVETGNGVIISLRTSDGTRLWQVQPFASPFSADSIQVVDGIVYTFSRLGDAKDETVVALHVSDGSLLWQRKISLATNLFSLQISHGLFFADAGSIIAVLRASDGKELWNMKHTQLSLQYASFRSLDVVGDQVLLQTSDSTLEVHRLDTGGVVWRYPH